VQIGTNLANDYFDFVRGADTAERQGPTRVTQAGFVSPTAMKRAIIAAFGITALFGCFLIFHGGIIMAGLVAIAILLGLAYTAGPFPIGYLGLSEFFVVFFFGSLAVAGTYFLQTGSWSSEAWLLGLGPGLLSCAILTVNNLRDVEQDRAAGKKTLVVRLGKWFGKAEYLMFVLAAMAIPLLFIDQHPLSLLCWLSLPPAIPLMVTICRASEPKDIEFSRTPFHAKRSSKNGKSFCFPTSTKRETNNGPRPPPCQDVAERLAKMSFKQSIT
jgi:1,4-dihydroxy-2-naphthoate octaprenyltransferase